MRLYLSFDKPWLELKIDKILIKIKLIKLIFFKLTLLKIIKLCVTNNHFICSFIKNLQEFKSSKWGSFDFCIKKSEGISTKNTFCPKRKFKVFR